MASVAAQLRELRLQVEKLQVEVKGRQEISAMVVWDGQKQSSVNSETSRQQEDFSGLVVHLTPEVSAPVETLDEAKSETSGLDQNEFNALKEAIVRSLDS